VEGSVIERVQAEEGTQEGWKGREDFRKKRVHMQSLIPEWSECFPLVGFFPGDDVVQDNAEAIHIHSEAGRVFKADQLRRHVRWGASLQTQINNIIKAALSPSISWHRGSLTGLSSCQSQVGPSPRCLSFTCCVHALKAFLNR
jgi:hypothetical protein